MANKMELDHLVTARGLLLRAQSEIEAINRDTENHAIRSHALWLWEEAENLQRKITQMQNSLLINAGPM